MDGQEAKLEFSTTPPGTRVDLRVRGLGVAVVGDAADVTVTPAGDETSVGLTLGSSGVVELTGVRR